MRMSGWLDDRPGDILIFIIVPGIVDVLPAVSHAAVKTTFTLGLSPNDHFSASLMYSALSTVYSLLVVLEMCIRDRIYTISTGEEQQEVMQKMEMII